LRTLSLSVGDHDARPHDCLHILMMISDAPRVTMVDRVPAAAEDVRVPV
jgi:hypothetical protein